jgi:hypothetical protein
MKESNKYDEVIEALNKYFNALFRLKELNVAPNSKDFTSQLGEWLIAEIYDGKKAESGIQKDWDIKIGNELVQVKTHAKAETTTARWSALKYNIDANVDLVIIVVFSHEFKLKEFYQVPWVKCIELIKRNKDRDVIMWNDLKDYKVELTSLPKQELVTYFL